MTTRKVYKIIPIILLLKNFLRSNVSRSILFSLVSYLKKAD